MKPTKTTLLASSWRTRESRHRKLIKHITSDYLLFVLEHTHVLSRKASCRTPYLPLLILLDARRRQAEWTKSVTGVVAGAGAFGSFGATKFIVMYSVFICYFWYYKMDVCEGYGSVRWFLFCNWVNAAPHRLDGIRPHHKQTKTNKWTIEGENRT